MGCNGTTTTTLPPTRTRTKTLPPPTRTRTTTSYECYLTVLSILKAGAGSYIIFCKLDNDGGKDNGRADKHFKDDDDDEDDDDDDDDYGILDEDGDNCDF